MTNSWHVFFLPHVSLLGCNLSSGWYPEAAEEAKKQGGREAVGHQWVHAGDVTIKQESINNQL